ncbi:MAG: DUF3011 domain-containing protein [Pseudomonadota bacterium]|nr:DUF3011 domain-containing protein [Pseudomonadota bacterium]
MKGTLQRACLAVGLLSLALPLGSSAGSAQGSMQIGLTIVAPSEARSGASSALRAEAGSGASSALRAEVSSGASSALRAATSEPASVEIRCASPGLGYHECRSPFRGPVVLDRVTSDVICIEGGNWGWRAGAVWVDRGCSGVFVSRPPAATVAARSP